MTASELILLRPMRATDLAQVADWLAQPHVARWFLTGSTAAEDELDELRAAIDGTEPTHALIVHDVSREIGWCQWYRCADYAEHARAMQAGPDDVGIDYAIGEANRVGRGVGTALIAALVEHVRAKHPQAGVIADPEAANLASRRVLEKNGFTMLFEARLATEPTDSLMAIYRLAPSSEAS